MHRNSKAFTAVLCNRNITIFELPTVSYGPNVYWLGFLCVVVPKIYFFKPIFICTDSIYLYIYDYFTFITIISMPSCALSVILFNEYNPALCGNDKK